MIVEHLRIGSANVGTMLGNSLEIDEMTSRRCLGFRCLHETRWRGGSSGFFSESTFFWIGCKKEWQG